MLFWHVALLFSVFCASVLASPAGNSLPRTGYRNMRGCWHNPDAKKWIAIVGGKITYSSQGIGDALKNTYWKPSNCPEGCSTSSCGTKLERTKVVSHEIHLLEWDPKGNSYSVSFHPGNIDTYDGLGWRRAKPLKIGGSAKIEMKNAQQSVVETSESAAT
ncbi:hypothetical protein AX14_014128 [Amanita brunnescens Koide BX004]|nr:hypothetical protein AX14_014128 [Amanita brunnescens Koide BX004]